MKHEEIAILAGADLHLGAVSGEKPAIVADPDLDGRVIATHGPHRLAWAAESEEGKEQGRDHGTSRITAVPAWKLRLGTGL